MCAWAKTTTGRFEEKATAPKGVRSSGEISYDISTLKDYRNDLTEELFRLNNGTGRYTEEGAARVTEIESTLADLRKTERSLDAELKQANQAETQALIDSGEYRKANFKDVTVNAFNQGRYNAKYGQESYKDMQGQENNKETYAQILADEDYKYLPQSRAAKLVSGVSGQLGQMFSQLSDPRTLNTGIAGAGTGAGIALAAGQAGPQVLLPEEVLTVPGGMAAGFFAGVKAGSAAVNFEIEAGLAYNELLANGVSEKTARNIALGVGGANAALELVQLDELTDAFKITKQTGATKNVAKALAEEIVKRTGGVARETAQEVLQEGVTVAGVQAGTKLDTGKWAYDTKEVAQRLWDTGASAAGTFGALNVPSTAVDIAAMRQQLIDRQHQQSMDELAAEYEKNVGMPIYKEESYMRVQQEQSIAKSEVSKYNNIIGKHIQEDCTALLQAAKNGERHEGIYADAVKKDQRKLKKSIASHAAQVEEHAAKIANPSIYDVGWMDKDQRAKEGLLRKWEKDMKRNAEQAAIEIAVWEERYGNEQ